MGLSCGATFAKYVLCIFNILFFLGGGAVLGMGIWLRVDTAGVSSMIHNVHPTGNSTDLSNNVLFSNINTIHIMAYVLIAVGGFVFLVGFLGCCGACQEWRPMLVIYAVCLIIIMGVEVGLGIAVGVYKIEMKEMVKKELQKVAVNYDNVPTFVDKSGFVKVLQDNFTVDPVYVEDTAAMNTLQAWVGCCGIENYTADFALSPYHVKNPSMLAPVFCCKFTKPTEFKLMDRACAQPDRREDPYISNANTGCVTKIEIFMKANAPIVIGVAVGIGLMELIGICLAFCLCCEIGSKLYA